VRRGRVYRAFDVLEELRLIRRSGSVTSDEGGPQRTIVEVTAGGRERVAGWLTTPIDHVRDARSELLLKLLFLDRHDLDTDALLDAQHERFRTRERE
jgi:DNA-binding PadR family transcriptional regulator